MKIGKLFLATLLMAAVILPASAQDRQYDVKLTIYPKEEVQQKKQEKQKKEKTQRKQNREIRKEEKAQNRFEKTYYNEPAKIEPAHKGQPDAAPVRPVVAEVTYEENGNNPYESTEVVYPDEPVKIKAQHVNADRTPVRPRETHEPVVAPAAPECEKKCDKPCEKDCKACCGDNCKACCGENCKACCGEKMCAKAQECDMRPCPMEGKPMGKMCAMYPPAFAAPLFYSNAQYRDYKRMLRAQAVQNTVRGFEGDRFYVGTNALADLVLAPNFQFEWRRDEKMGVRLTVGGFYWPWLGDNKGDSSNGGGGFWITPEIRWYLGAKRAWYAGAMAQLGYACNSYEDYTMYSYYPASTETIEEKNLMISAGGTFGYMQRINRNFGIDYNVGVGFSAIGQKSTHSQGTGWYGAFSFTQVGVSLVWGVCNKGCGK